MKIIKPIQLGDQNATVSGANTESAPLWEPVGRDYALDMSTPLMSVAGDHVYLLDRDTGELREHDIMSGLTVVLGMLGLEHRAWKVAVSPDRQWVAVAVRYHESGLGTVVTLRLFDRNGLSEVFTERLYHDGYHTPLAWAPDSSGLAFASSLDFSGGTSSKPRIGFVRVADFSTVYSQTFAAARGDSYPLDEYRNENLRDLCFDGGGRIFAIGIFSDLGYFENMVLRFDPLTGVEGGYVGQYLSRSADGDREFFFGNFNPARNELVINGLTTTIDPDTLLPTQVQPSPEISIQQAPQPKVSPDGTELLIIQPDVQPYIRRFSTANYGALQAVAALDGRDVTDAAYSDEYIAFSMPAGFRLVDRSTLALDEQQYPIVQAGDIYRFSDRRYEALIDNQTRPDEGVATDPPSWMDLGVVNRLRAFDGKLTSQMVGGETVSVRISPSSTISGIGVFSVQAQGLRLQVINSAEQVVWDSGYQSLIDPAFDGQDESDPIAQISDYVFTNFPFSVGQKVQLILSSASSGVTKIGQVIAGTVREIGDSLFGARVGILDFSRKERDIFGDFDITERRFSNRAELPVSIRTADIAYVRRVLADVRATPVAYIGAESQRETIIYGFFRSFDIVLDGPVWSECVIEVEGL